MRLGTSDGSRANPNFSRAANEVIRELEAELELLGTTDREIIDRLKARAEKAEARVAELETRRYPDAQCRNVCIEAREWEYVLHPDVRREREAKTGG